MNIDADEEQRQVLYFDSQRTSTAQEATDYYRLRVSTSLAMRQNTPTG